MNIQITWEGGGDVWAFPEVWSAPDDEGGDYLGGNEGIDPEIINLGNGMWHGTWLGDVSSVGEYVVALIGGEGVAIHQLVVDAVIHDGGTPAGTGQRPGAPERGPAANPNPSDEATFVDRDAALSWSPGIYAATHNVYFGTDFDDVNEAGTDSDLLVNPGQAGTSYDPPGLLDWGRSYYWRIDEVNGPANPGVHKGKTWSFTVEPYVYGMTLDEHIIAVTASSFDPKYESNNTINLSGLDADGLHDVNEYNMWLSDRDATEPAWIQYQFDWRYKLHELLVWNYDRFREDRLGYGFKEVLIPGIAADTVRIGGSLNSSYPYNQGVSDLVGDIDNIRIFNFTLTLEDIHRLPVIPTAPADLNGDGIVDQADQDIVEANIGPEKLWP